MKFTGCNEGGNKGNCAGAAGSCESQGVGCFITVIGSCGTWNPYQYGNGDTDAYTLEVCKWKTGDFTAWCGTPATMCWTSKEAASGGTEACPAQLNGYECVAGVYSHKQNCESNGGCCNPASTPYAPINCPESVNCDSLAICKAPASKSGTGWRLKYTNAECSAASTNSVVSSLKKCRDAAANRHANWFEFGKEDDYNSGAIVGVDLTDSTQGKCYLPPTYHTINFDDTTLGNYLGSSCRLIHDNQEHIFEVF